jgi:two-component system cell cycle sensor histidine kinase/response regulator CckA
MPAGGCPHLTMSPHSAELPAADLRRILDSVFAFVAILDVDGILVEVNRAPLELAGLRREDVIGRPFVDAYWFDSLPQAQRQIVAAVESAAHGQSVRDEFTVRVSDDQLVTLDALITPLRSDTGEIRQVIASGRDITERKAAEEALRASEERFRQIAESIREVFWLADPNGQLIYMSPAYESVWGRSRAGVYASENDWRHAAVHPDDRARIGEARSIERLGGEFDEEFRIVRPDGTIRWIRDRAFPVWDAEQRVIRIAGVAEDITERRELEFQVRQAHKMEAVGQLAGGVAHDFNNLLTVILGHSELVIDALPIDDPHRESLEEIRRMAERAASLTRQLLTFSSKQVLAPVVMSVGDIVRDTDHLLRRLLGDSITLTTRLDAGGDTVRADPAQVAQMLVTLAANGRDAMPLGGTMTIETAIVQVGGAETPEVRGLPAGPYVALTVSDSGAGMAPEIQQHLFEPFFTTKELGRGTGLGLAVVHGFIKQSQGHIEVSSEAQTGTTFRIFLPRVESKRTELRAASLTMGTGTILLVEDEDAVRAIARRVLQTRGYTVVEASNGEEGIRQYLQLGGQVSLVITDVVMPVIGGRVLAERLLALNPRLKVLFMSGYSDDADVRDGHLGSEMHFLQKPFTPGDLATKVSDLLRE